ncbi:hypothetical protein Mgra_00001640, partial [Meloidogyne graminicola]
GGIEINTEFINVPINISLWIDPYKPIEAEIIRYKNSLEYRYVGIYREIINNQKVTINNNKIGIYDYLLKQNYLIGISEFEVMAGAFAIFEALGIKNTVNIANTVFFPSYLQFIGINVEQTFKISNFYSALPGNWNKKKGICKENSVRYKKNSEEQKAEFKDIEKDFTKYAPELYNKIFINENIEGINKHSNLAILFNKIKYHFINQNKFGNFEDFPKSNKIIYIGGILVEDKGILTEEKIESENENSCIVLLSFGSVNIEEIFNKLNNDGAIEKMFKAFENHKNCIFKIRIIKEYLPKEFYSKNIEIYEENIKQQEILSKQNTKLFISHCGVNSINEAIYAGIPLLCIPFRGDQFYNSSIIEQIGNGIYVSEYSKINNKKNGNFGNDFKNALNKLLNKK